MGMLKRITAIEVMSGDRIVIGKLGDAIRLDVVSVYPTVDGLVRIETSDHVARYFGASIRVEVDNEGA